MLRHVRKAKYNHEIVWLRAAADDFDHAAAILKKEQRRASLYDINLENMVMD